MVRGISTKIRDDIPWNSQKKKSNASKAGEENWIFFLPGYFSQVLAEVLMRDRPPFHPGTNVIGYMKPQKMSLFKNVRYNTKGKLGLVFFPLDHGLIETIQKWFLLNLVIFMIEIVLLMITMCRIITWKVLIMQLIWSVVVVSLQIIFLPQAYLTTRRLASWNSDLF